MLRQKEAIKYLRNELRKRPLAEFAAGMLPVVGTAIAVNDFIEEPSPLGAAGLALGPVAKKIKALRAKRDIMVPDSMALPEEIPGLEKAKKAFDRNPFSMQSVSKGLNPVQARLALAELRHRFAREHEGWYPWSDGKFRKELPENVSWDVPTIRGLPKDKIVARADDVSRHPDLYKRMDKIPWIMTQKDMGGSYNTGRNLMKIGLGRGDEDWVKDVANHELQHAVQTRGGVPDAFRGANWEGLPGGMREYMKNPGEIEARIAAMQHGLAPPTRKHFTAPRMAAYMRNMQDEKYPYNVENMDDLIVSHLKHLRSMKK